MHLLCLQDQLPLEKLRSHQDTWYQVDNKNVQAVALPGRVASAKSLYLLIPFEKGNLRLAIVPTDQEQNQGLALLYNVIFSANCLEF